MKQTLLISALYNPLISLPIHQRKASWAPVHGEIDMLAMDEISVLIMLVMICRLMYVYV